MQCAARNVFTALTLDQRIHGQMMWQNINIAKGTTDPRVEFSLRRGVRSDVQYLMAVLEKGPSGLKVLDYEIKH